MPGATAGFADASDLVTGDRPRAHAGAATTNAANRTTEINERIRSHPSVVRKFP